MVIIKIAKNLESYLRLHHRVATMVVANGTSQN
jgi:hypothetical protein